MSIAEIITGLLSVAAVVISILALREARRSASANEDSAWYAGRANDLTFFSQVQALNEQTRAEAAKERAAGNESKANALEGLNARLQLDMLKRFANENDDTKQAFAKYFRGLAENTPDEKETIENLISYVLEDKLPDEGK